MDEITSAGYVVGAGIAGNSSYQHGGQSRKREPVSMRDFKQILAEVNLTPEQLEGVVVRDDGVIDLSRTNIGMLRQ